MTPRAELERLIEMEKRATKGPWHVVIGMRWLLECDDSNWTIGDFERGDEDSPISEEEANANAAFVCALRNFFPRMVEMMKEQGDVDSTARK